jgi:signal transduction histidine kinase
MESPGSTYIKKDLNTWERFLTTERSWIKRYLFACIVSGISLGLVVLFEFIEAEFLTSLALLSVILSALYGGRGPAFLDVVITSFGIDYFFAKPYYQVLDSNTSFVRLAIAVFVGYLIAGLVNSLKKSFIALKYQKDTVEIEKKERENMLGVVSHDLRSPLSSIIMSADLLLRELGANKSSASAPMLVTNIKKSAYRMNRLTEDLLDAIKSDAGHLKIERNDYDISQIIQTAVDESLPTAKNKNIVINIQHCLASPIAIYCDDSRIIQVMNNLLGNAIKFSPSDSEVLVKIDSTDTEVKIEIKDRGQGISTEDQLHLFDRFWQAKDTAHKGTGLGLFISKRIIELHGGSIEVHSILGEGSTFLVHLPKLKYEK